MLRIRHGLVGNRRIAAGALLVGIAFCAGPSRHAAADGPQGGGFDLTPGPQSNYLRPLSVTGNFAAPVGVPDSRPGGFGNTVATAFTMRYSLRDLRGRDPTAASGPLGHVSPIVEFSETASAAPSLRLPNTAFIAPGFIYSRQGIDYGLQAVLPATRTGGGLGVIASAHIALENLTPSFHLPLSRGRSPLAAARPR